MAYNSTELFFADLKNNISLAFCFGFEISNVYPGVPEINITYMMPRDTASNTFEPLFDVTTGMPNMFHWNNTFTYGTPQFMLFVTDTLLMLLTGHRTHDI